MKLSGLKIELREDTFSRTGAVRGGSYYHHEGYAATTEQHYFVRAFSSSFNGLRCIFGRGSVGNEA